MHNQNNSNKLTIKYFKTPVNKPLNVKSTPPTQKLNENIYTHTIYNYIHYLITNKPMNNFIAIQQIPQIIEFLINFYLINNGHYEFNHNKLIILYNSFSNNMPITEAQWNEPILYDNINKIKFKFTQIQKPQ